MIVPAIQTVHSFVRYDMNIRALMSIPFMGTKGEKIQYDRSIFHPCFEVIKNKPVPGFNLLVRCREEKGEKNVVGFSESR